MDSAILIMPGGSGFYPIAPRALKVANATRRELRSNIGALLFYRDGTVRRINQLRPVSLFGEGLRQKIFSALASAWNIEVSLSDPLPMDLVDIKAALAPMLDRHIELEQPARQKDEIWSAFHSAKTPDELFVALRVPSSEFCLDCL